MANVIKTLVAFDHASTSGGKTRTALSMTAYGFLKSPIIEFAPYVILSASPPFFRWAEVEGLVNFGKIKSHITNAKRLATAVNTLSALEHASTSLLFAFVAALCMT